LGGQRGRLIPKADRVQAIELIQEACTHGARKHKACDILDISVRTLERWEKGAGLEDQRRHAKRTPGNKLSAKEEQQILAVVNNEKYKDSPVSQIVPALADEGCYIASESTFYRVLRRNKQSTHRGNSKPKSHTRPRAAIASGPGQVWSWDITYLPTQIRGLFFYLYMIIDIYSRKIVGWSIHDEQLSTHAANLIHQACLDENVEQNQLRLHSDNGSPMKGATMLAMLENLGVAPSFSRPSVSNDNPYSESLFRTTKYHATFPSERRFETIIDARKWCEQFVRWYNNEHKHSGIKFVTPQQRHTGEDGLIRYKRHCVYEEAKVRFPERWSGNTRNWTLPGYVTLNPDKKQGLTTEKIDDILPLAV